MTTETFVCDSLPCGDKASLTGSCQGHRVTKRLREIADVICWTERIEHLDELEERLLRWDYYRLALRYLTDSRGNDD